MTERVCPDCGSDRYYARNFARVRDEAQMWQMRAKQLAAKVAQLELDMEYEKFKDRTDVAWLQGKVVAQARELKRLNDARNARRVKENQAPAPDKQVQSITRVEIGG